MVRKGTVLSGGGRSGAILRRIRWSGTCIGRPDEWPEALRVSLKIVLTTGHPMAIWWGGRFLQFYNDGFGDIARSFFRSHGLGLPGNDYWGAIWERFGPDVRSVMDGHDAIQRKRKLIEAAIDGHALQRYWTYSISPILQDGKVGGVLFLCQDETEEIREKAALEARDTALARVQQIVRLGGLEVKLTSGFRNLRSPEYLLIHGLPPAEANETHENWVKRIHPEDRHRTESAFIKAVTGKSGGYAIQYRIIRPSDQKTRWISAKTEIERDLGGNAIRLIGVHVDITDQVDSQEIERAQFTAALDVLRCAVVLADASGGIVYANHTARRMLEEGATVRSRQNRIVAVDPSACVRLSDAVRSAAVRDRRTTHGLAIKLSGFEMSPVVAHVLPLGGTEFESRIAPAVAAIFIRDREDAGSNACLLASAYELTSAETRVLSWLLAGRSLPETAKALRVASSTVRTHLDVIFRKTGVNRQSELILLASQLSPPIRQR